MKINIEIDDKLIAKARTLNKELTDQAIIENALRLFVVIETQKSLKNLYGKIKIDEAAFL
ncbi:MAG: type II toxin-antitoxin system VapB family antitoxin [Mucilaginibacter sp.]